MVFLHITTLCNYMCEYCSVGLPYQKNYSVYNMPLNLIKYLIYMIEKYLSNFNVYICLVGGEPLLYPHLIDIIQLFSISKNIKKLFIFSNNSVEINNIINDNISIPIYFSFSLHIDYMKKLGYNKQISVFIDNIKYLNQLPNRINYNVKILHDELHNKEYMSALNHLSLYIPLQDIQLVNLHSTQWYHTDDSHCESFNPIYNTYALPYSFITVIRDTNTKKILMVNDCDMIHYVTTIYDTNYWKKLQMKYSYRKLCTIKNFICKKCQFFHKLER